MTGHVGAMPGQPGSSPADLPPERALALPARPAVDPALPPRVRRRLARLHAAVYHGDPADGPPERCWRNPLAVVWRCLDLNMLCAPIARQPRYPQNRAELGGMLYWVAAAMAVMASTRARTLLAPAAVLAVMLALPVLPAMARAWTRRRHRGRYICHSQLGPVERALLARAQHAADAAVAAAPALGGLTEDPRPAAPWHEWDIAVTLLGASEAGSADPGAQAAVDAVAGHVAALENYAAALARRAAGASSRSVSAPAAAMPHSLSDDLAAVTAAHACHAAVLNDLTARAASRDPD